MKVKNSLTALALAAVAFTGISCCNSSFDRSSIRPLADKVAQWQMENFTDSILPKAHWANAALYRGMMDWAEYSGSETIYNWLENIGESSDWGLLSRVYDADDFCVGQLYLRMAEKSGDESKAAAIIERCDYVMANPDLSPLLDPESGKYYRNRWGWCDALFMAPPVFAELAKYKENPAYLDFCYSEYQVTVDSLYSRVDKLFYRDLTLVQDREPNGKQVFWGRGNGWVYAGLCLMLETVPAEHPSYQYYLDIYKEMTESVVALQDKNGSWHAGLYDPVNWPSPENSASGFFTYGLAWGVNHGVLTAPACRKAAIKGWNALSSYVHEDGMLGYVQPIGHSPVDVTYDMTAVYGVGAFLLAATEMDQLN